MSTRWKSRRAIPLVCALSVSFVGVIALGTPPIESTGFEPPDWDAYAPGESNYICGELYWDTCVPSPFLNVCTGNPGTDVTCCSAHPNPLNGWYVSDTSQHCREPHIDIVNPANPGGQHLRFGFEPGICQSSNGDCSYTAYSPDMGLQTEGAFTITWDLSIPSTPFGCSLKYYSLGSPGSPSATLIYFYGTYIYIDNRLVGMGTLGSYRRVRIENNPCESGGTVRYYYDDQLIYTRNSERTQGIRRAVFQGYGIDIDNYSVVRSATPCDPVCGNGVVEFGEFCEPGVPGFCPPGHCVPAGNPDQCTCLPGCATAEICEDNVDCTIDECVNQECVRTVTDALCGDNNICNGIETCDPYVGCLAGTPLNCDDDLFCNGIEYCNSISGCQPGVPPNCDDGVACTVDQCDEATRSCTHTLNDAACDDGVFCNGMEVCTPTGCASGASPCMIDEICDEATRTCSPRFTPIPTVSQWGLIVIGLAILIVAKGRSRRDARLSQ